MWGAFAPPTQGPAPLRTDLPCAPCPSPSHRTCPPCLAVACPCWAAFLDTVPQHTQPTRRKRVPSKVRSSNPTPPGCPWRGPRGRGPEPVARGPWSAESDPSLSGVSTELHGRRDSADGAVLDAWWVLGTQVGPLSSLKRELRVRGGGAMGAGVRGMRAQARERRHLWTLGTAKPRVPSEPLEGAQEVPPREPAPGPVEGPRHQVSPGPPSRSDTAPGPAILSSGLHATPANKVAVVPT